MSYISTNETKKAAVARALGLDQPSGLDMVSRSNYADVDSYLDAATRAELERRSPEYLETRRRLAAEYDAREEKRIRQEQAESYKAHRANVKLWPVDVREIDEKATEMAQRDLAAGRIHASGLGEAIKKYADELTEKKKDEKASNAMMNELFRRG